MTDTSNRPSNPSKCPVAQFDEIAGVWGRATTLRKCSRFPNGADSQGNIGGVNVFFEPGYRSAMSQAERVIVLGERISRMCDDCGSFETSFGELVGDFFSA